MHLYADQGYFASQAENNRARPKAWCNPRTPCTRRPDPQSPNPAFSKFYSFFGIEILSHRRAAASNPTTGHTQMLVSGQSFAEWGDPRVAWKTRSIELLWSLWRVERGEAIQEANGWPRPQLWVPTRRSQISGAILEHAVHQHGMLHPQSQPSHVSESPSSTLEPIPIVAWSSLI